MASFPFTIPGLVVAGVGLIYVMFVLPIILPDRTGYDSGNALGPAAKQFQAQVKVIEDSSLDGMQPVSGFFPELKGITVLMVIREEEQFFPPYDDITLQAGDVLVVAATRELLAELLGDDPALLRPDLANAPEFERKRIAQAWHKGEQTMAEAMV